MAIDRDTREIVGVYIGDRSEQSARALWASLPAVYRQCAVSYTDFWAAYAAVFPAKRHQAVGKDSGLDHALVQLQRLDSGQQGKPLILKP